MVGLNLQTPLAGSKTAIYGVLFVNVWQAVAMPTIILLAGLQSIPEDLFESAMIDGGITLAELPLHHTSFFSSDIDCKYGA